MAILEGKLVLSFDLGTTAIKVGLFNLKGELLQTATREQRLIFFEDGRVEQSPRATWELIASSVREVMVGRSPSQVKAIALSVHRGTVIPLDANGEPLSDFIVWMDKRGLAIAQEVAARIGQERYYNISGHPMSYITGVSKALWLHHQAKDLQAELAVIAPHETLFLKWLGCTDLVCAQSTGTYLFPFVIESKTWSPQLAQELDFPLDKLPRLVTSTEVVGELSRKAAQELGLLPGIAIVPGGGDGQCAGVGSGAVEEGLCMINIGTGAGIQTYLVRPLKDPRHVLNCAAHVVPDGWEMEGHTQASGIVFRWLRDEFGAAELAVEHHSGLDAFDLLVEQARHTPAGAGGLLFLPTFNGSTAPVIDQTARGALLGLSLAHGRRHVIRAVLEGISLELRWMLDAISEAGTTIREVRLVGGGARNAHWNQIHAGILDRPVRTLQIVDAALVGAAMCAAVAVGEYKDLHAAAEQFVKFRDTIEPLEADRPVYQAAYENYRQAFTLLSESGFFRRLQGEQSGKVKI